MNLVCHGDSAGQQNAVAGDAAIHLDFSWIATPDCVGLAMTNDGCSLAGVREAGDDAIHGWIAIPPWRDRTRDDTACHTTTLPCFNLPCDGFSLVVSKPGLPACQTRSVQPDDSQEMRRKRLQHHRIAD